MTGSPRSAPLLRGFAWLVPDGHRRIRSKTSWLENQVPYQWLDIEAGEEAPLGPVHAEPDSPHLPLVLFPDGSRLIQPSSGQIAEKIGLGRVRKALLRSGYRGWWSGWFGSSRSMERLKGWYGDEEAPGAGRVEFPDRELPGLPSGTEWGDLARRAVAQARRFRDPHATG